MARKSKENITQTKFSIIEKLALLGITTEEQMKKLTPKEVASLEDVSFNDIEIIRQLQECVKENKVFSFLTAEITITTEEPKSEKTIKKKKADSEVTTDGE